MAKRLTKTDVEPSQASTIPPGGRKPEREPAGVAATRAAIPRHDTIRKWPFILVWSGSWELGTVEGEPYLLPVIDPHRDMPGSQCISQRKKGQPPDTRKRDGALVEDHRVIFRGDEVSYKISVEQDDGNKESFYYCQWEDVTEYEDGVVLVRHMPDEYNAWRLGLIRRGLVRQPHDGNLQVLTRTRESLAVRAQHHPDNQEYWSAKLKRLRAELEVLPQAFRATVKLYRSAA